MSISDVHQKGDYYQIFDSSGKQSKEIRASSVGDLCGIGANFVVFLKENYFATYDENFKRSKKFTVPQ